MVIKAKHLHVDSKGTCYLPYLSGWHVGCSLLQLAVELIQMFTKDPPVRSKTAMPPRMKQSKRRTLSEPAAPLSAPTFASVYSPYPAPVMSFSCVSHIAAILPFNPEH